MSSHVKTSATSNALTDASGSAASLISGSHFASALVSIGDMDADGTPPPPKHTQPSPVITRPCAPAPTVADAGAG